MTDKDWEDFRQIISVYIASLKRKTNIELNESLERWTEERWTDVVKNGAIELLGVSSELRKECLRELYHRAIHDS